MRYNKMLALSCLVCSTIFTIPSVYLSRIKNETPDTLYKIIIPAEDYEILLPPGTQKYLGEWFDVQRGNDLQLAVLKGDGEPVFVIQGPESAGCDKDMMAQSVVYWTGSPTIDESQKMYQTYCLANKDVKLELCLNADCQPELTELKD